MIADIDAAGGDTAGGDTSRALAGRRFDPDRRRRIAEAALRVVEEQGLEAVTHRAVAKVADVPVGSTTYHFANKEAMLLAAMGLAQQRSTTRLSTSLSRFLVGADLPRALALLVEETTVHHRAALACDYQFYLGALYHPALRDAVGAWPETTRRLIAEHADAATATALAYAFGGMIVHSAVRKILVLAPEAEAVFRRIAE